MVGLFHENWSGTTLDQLSPAGKSFTVARKPVSHAHRDEQLNDVPQAVNPAPFAMNRPRSKTLGPQPQPRGTPIRRVPVSTAPTNVRFSMVNAEDLDLPPFEPIGKLEMNVHEFHCFTPVNERESFL